MTNIAHTISKRLTLNLHSSFCVILLMAMGWSCNCTNSKTHTRSHHGLVRRGTESKYILISCCGGPQQKRSLDESQIGILMSGITRAPPYPQHTHTHHPCVSAPRHRALPRVDDRKPRAGEEHTDVN